MTILKSRVAGVLASSLSVLSDGGRNPAKLCDEALARQHSGSEENGQAEWGADPGLSGV